VLTINRKIKANIEVFEILYEGIKKSSILSGLKIGDILNIAIFEYLKDKSILTFKEIDEIKKNIV
jgi:hypothetical protein